MQRRILSTLLIAALLCGCTPRQSHKADDMERAHQLAVRQAQGLGEAPPDFPAEPKPASFWRLVSYACYSGALLCTAGALAVAADDRGTSKSQAPLTALLGLSGAFLGSGLSMTWYADKLEHPSHSKTAQP